MYSYNVYIYILVSVFNKDKTKWRKKILNRDGVDHISYQYNPLNHSTTLSKLLSIAMSKSHNCDMFSDFWRCQKDAAA